MHLCVCVRVSVNLHVHVYVCVCVHVYLCTHLYISACINLYIYKTIHLAILVYLWHVTLHIVHPTAGGPLECSNRQVGICSHGKIIDRVGWNGDNITTMSYDFVCKIREQTQHTAVQNNFLIQISIHWRSIPDVHSALMI